MHTCAIVTARKRPVLAELCEEGALVSREAVAGVGIEILASDATPYSVTVRRLRRFEARNVADALVQAT
jgi:hypothetical protein